MSTESKHHYSTLWRGEFFHVSQWNSSSDYLGSFYIHRLKTIRRSSDAKWSVCNRNIDFRGKMYSSLFLLDTTCADVNYFLLDTTSADVNYFMLSCRYRRFALTIQRKVLGISLQNNALRRRWITYISNCFPSQEKVSDAGNCIVVEKPLGLAGVWEAQEL